MVPRERWEPKRIRRDWARTTKVTPVGALSGSLGGRECVWFRPDWCWGQLGPNYHLAVRPRHLCNSGPFRPKMNDRMALSPLLVWRNMIEEEKKTRYCGGLVFDWWSTWGQRVEDHPPNILFNIFSVTARWYPGLPFFLFSSIIAN